MRSRLRQEHFRSNELPAAVFAVAARARPAVGVQRIKFVITWSGGTAALDHLTYNTLLVEEEPQYDAPNRITVEFDRPREAVHLFEWTLLFPNKELTNLEAGAQIDGGPLHVIAHDDSAKTAWRPPPAHT